MNVNSMEKWLIICVFAHWPTFAYKRPLLLLYILMQVCTWPAGQVPTKTDQSPVQTPHNDYIYNMTRLQGP